MKRILIFILCALLLSGCSGTAPSPIAAPTAAPTAEPTPSPFPTVYVEKGMATVIDLDGDGEKEQIEIETVQLNEYMEYHTVRVTDGELVQRAGETMIASSPRITLTDLDGDRVPEILLSGDVASDDYVTYACRWTSNGLQAISFSGEVRSDVSSGAFVDGGVDTAENGTVMLGSHLFMLGTYQGYRPYELKEDGSIGPVEDSIWVFRGNEFWMETAMDLSEELPAGTKLRLTGADGVAQVWYVTEDGRQGSLTLSESEDKWGWCINGVHELECFVELPYAG